MWNLPPKHFITIFTDGSCSRGKGGWAASLYYLDGTLYLSGNEDNTTNNRMELTAVVKALESLPVACTVQLYSDSQYVIHGIRHGIDRWLLTDWQTTSGKEVINRDLWEKLAVLKSIHVILPTWVKGHNGDPGNEAVDSLAQYVRSLPV